MAKKDATKGEGNKKTFQSTTDNSHLNQESSASASSPPASMSFIKRLWNILKYVLLSLLIPPFLNYASLNREFSYLQSDGLSYDIGHGQMLYMRCQGTGWPTVILDAPTGSNSDVWAIIQSHVSKTTKVCVYDRAGLGLSSTPIKQNKSDSEENRMKSFNRWQEFTVERMVDDVRRLFTQSSEQKKPFVYVGSELGATIARFYANLYEGDVSDLVLVDPLVEDVFTHDNQVWLNFWYDHLIPSIQSLQFSAAIGLTRLLLIAGIMDVPMAGAELDDQFVARQKYVLCNPRHLSASVEEHHFINQTFSQIRMLKRIKQFPSNISVTVITGNYYDEQLPQELNKAWAKSQQNLISSIHPNSNHIVVNGADHTMIYKHPNAIIDAIRKIIRDRRYQDVHYSEGRNTINM